MLGCTGVSTAPVREPSEPAWKKGIYIVKRGDTLYSIAWAAGVDYRRLASWNGIGPPYLIKPGQRLKLVPRRASRHPNKARPPKGSPPSRSSALASAWVWPTQGTVIRGFSAKRGSKGIDIGGRYGDPVRSANGGRVVYAGSGLRGYGKLIIVKHNETFLSAYAHNRKLLVREGSRVATGQRIAEMGNTGTTRVKLHFEIRRHGAPVDPLRYLPRRGP